MPAPRTKAPRPLALVVDDSDQIRRDARRIVEAFGFEGEAMREPDAALRACAERMPALILVDWALPGMNGLEFLKALRAIPAGYRAAVIFLSGNGRPPDIHLAMRSGASEYLMKPFDADLLAFKLRQVGLIAA